MSPTNPRSLVPRARRLWTREDRQRKLAAQVSHRVEGTGGRRRTIVTVNDHYLPEFRTTDPRGRWLITQRRQLLDCPPFDEDACDKLDEASMDKGRRLYCLECDEILDPVMAAVSFHVDAERSLPLQLMAVAVRDDGPDVYAQSVLCAWYLTQYLQAIAVEVGRQPYVDFVDEHLDLQTEMKLLGFRHEPEPGYGARGRVYRQLP